MSIHDKNQGKYDNSSKQENLGERVVLKLLNNFLAKAIVCITITFFQRYLKRRYSHVEPFVKPEKDFLKICIY
ncbi:hypothetical protein NQ318_007591 [Aromia moschata]|uniref:Uncharacterized protein n=1 Tax=Aromia moschata TaxID=1265417 RepID=A0AAV8YC64_9CUCU|nr:hypothetical protein NQ318_007591 [Aromia moschata]